MKLFQGDCLDILPTLPDGSVDLVLCDLPYGTTQNKWDSVIPLEPLWREYWRLCRGAVVLTAQTPFDKTLGASCIEHLKYEWIWEKNNPSGHLNANKAPMKAHENVLVFYKKQPTYSPQKTTGHPLKQATRLGFSTNYGSQKVNSYASTERYPRSVQRINGHPKKDSVHPTQKPVALMEYFIRTYTNEGDTVLDNTMGSGTTGVAAVNTDRRFIGIEKDSEFFEIAQKRIYETYEAALLADAA